MVTETRSEMEQKVSLVRATADLADAQRRTAEEEAREARRERILADQEAAQRDFDIINAKWEDALSKQVNVLTVVLNLD